MKMYAMGGMNLGSFPVESTLTVNTSSELIKKLETLSDEKKETAASYLYQLAQLSQRKLTAEELQKFLADSYGILNML